MITSSQTLKPYEVLQKHFKNAEDAEAVVQETVGRIDTRFQSEKDRLATKADLVDLKTELAKAETRHIVWMVSFYTTLAGIIIA